MALIDIKSFTQELDILKNYINYKVDCSLNIGKRLKTFENFKKDFIEHRNTQIKRNIDRKNKESCYYCRCKLNHQTLTIDHIIPSSRGGNSTSYNKLSSCHRCNNVKADYLPTEFLKFLQKMKRRKNYRYQLDELTINIMIGSVRRLIKSKKEILNKMSRYSLI